VIFGPDETPGRVNLDVTWVASGRKMRFRRGSTDPADPANFEGDFRLAVATGSFSGSTEGFTFHGEGSSQGVFAEMGEERNGVFLGRVEHDHPGLDDASGILPAAATTTRALPNPARSGTDVQFSLPSSGSASLRIFDVTGREVATLVDQPALSAGAHSAHWDLRDLDGRRVPPGIYLIRLRTDSSSELHRLAVLP
jgi:hypothetical protein